MDYPVEASHPPIARFRLNESHLPAPLQSALIDKPLDKLYPLEYFARNCIFSVSKANVLCRKLLLSNYYINAFFARISQKYLIF